MVSADCQSFQFFGQINWFIRSNRALSKLTSRFLNFLISIIKLKKKNSIHKIQFYINHASHLEISNNLILETKIFDWKLMLSHRLILVEREPIC